MDWLCTIPRLIFSILTEKAVDFCCHTLLQRSESVTQITVKIIWWRTWTGMNGGGVLTGILEDDLKCKRVLTELFSKLKWVRVYRPVQCFLSCKGKQRGRQWKIASFVVEQKRCCCCSFVSLCTFQVSFIKCKSDGLINSKLYIAPISTKPVRIVRQPLKTHLYQTAARQKKWEMSSFQYNSKQLWKDRSVNLSWHIYAPLFQKINK